MTNSYEPVSLYIEQKTGFARIILSYVILNHKDVNVKSLGYISGMRNNSLHAIKMFYTTM
jgi:hypothetical protein